MSDRPPAAEGLLDGIRAVVPERIRKRLDAGNPAEGWGWSPTAVRTDNGETVTLALADGRVTGVTCSCLLSPKCLHVLAVASALPAAAVGAAKPATPAVPDEPPPAPAALDASQRSVVAATRRAVHAVLAAGAVGVGDTAREDLRRAVHGCRAVGLHRLAKAGARVSTALGDLQAGRPQFALADLAEDFRELLGVAHRLGSGAGTEHDVGVGRRTYEPIGTLRLYGVCSEPVSATTGYGGVSTLLLDATGRTWTVSDVRPGGAARAKAAYEAPAQVGGSTLSHRDLARHGLFLQEGTASRDGGLGLGSGVKAVRAGASALGDEAFARRFAEPPAAQLGREWVFLVATVLGAAGDAVVAAVDGLTRPVRLVAPSDHRELRYVDNLRVLARAPGVRIRLVARPEGRRRTLALVAIGAVPDGGLALPPEWGRCNLGYDSLLGMHFARLAPREHEVAMVEDDRPDPLAPLARRLERMVLGGRGSLPGEAGALVERERAALRAQHLGGGADTLGALFRVSVAGRARPPEDLAAAWLRAATWRAAADRHLARVDWG